MTFTISSLVKSAASREGGMTPEPRCASELSEALGRDTISDMALDLAACAHAVDGFAHCVSLPVLEEAISRLREATVAICATFREMEKRCNPHTPDAEGYVSEESNQEGGR